MDECAPGRFVMLIFDFTFRRRYIMHRNASFILNHYREPQMTWIRRLYKLSLLLLCAWIIVTGMFFWAGIWGIFVVPRSPEKPRGATWIVSREEDERFLNAPDTVFMTEEQKLVAPKSPAAALGAELAKKPKKPIEKRIIFKLPYWGLLLEQAKEHAAEEKK